LNNPAYEVAGASFRYRPSQPLLEGVDLTLAPGDFVALIGPNGAGKSTLLHLLTGWLQPAAGTVHLGGRPIGRWNRGAIARSVAVVPQREEGVFDFTVLEMVLMGRFPHASGTISFESEDDHRAAIEALERVCLAGFEHRSCQQLSGGERQRLLVARALAQETPIILLDEPTSSLDLGHQRMLFALLRELNEAGRTVLAISHDINLAAMYAKELAVLHRGRIVARGRPQEIVERSLLESVYQLPLSIIPTEYGIPAVFPRP
jgi:iron complex transport system ATP-binding protein